MPNPPLELSGEVPLACLLPKTAELTLRFWRKLGHGALLSSLSDLCSVNQASTRLEGTAPVCSIKVLLTWSTVQHSEFVVSTIKTASWKASRARIIPALICMAPREDRKGAIWMRVTKLIFPKIRTTPLVPYIHMHIYPSFCHSIACWTAAASHTAKTLDTAWHHARHASASAKEVAIDALPRSSER